MKLRWLRDQRGSILLFTTVLVVPLMIIIGGLALDLAYYGTVDDELQRSMDAAALAGAGKLGFNDTFFPTARQYAQQYAIANSYRADTSGKQINTSNFTLNTGNDPNGNIVLGIWDGSTFTPSLDGTRVNAVKCQFNSTVQTFFLRMLGMNLLPTAAGAIGWAAQPVTPPPTACVFPVSLSSCFFQGATSGGCGATITMISSSTGSAVGGNSGAWASVVPGQDANNSNILTQVKAAAGGNCSGTTLNTNNTIPVNGGQLNDVINWLSGPDQTAFPARYASSPMLEVLKQDGTPAYQGQGWEVFVPIIDTGSTCPPPGNITGTPTITGWTRLVITQVLAKNGTCAVANHWSGNPWDEHCLVSKNGTVPGGPSNLPSGWAGQTGIFGYYDCKYSPSPPAPNPGPISATAKLKLVK
jgi:Flp pilus assembly protein TadG